MIRFAVRRARNFLFLGLASLLLWAWYEAYATTLGNPQVVTGWLLLGVVVFLALYNVRKKLPFLPLGSSAGWLQFHAYCGIFSGLAFLFHLSFHAPDGVFHWGLALLFGIVAGSGVFGLVLSRIIPPRLTRRGEEVIYERIPRFRNQLRERAEEVALRSVGELRSAALADFYRANLAGFFAGPRNFLGHFIGSDAPRQRLHHEADELRNLLRDEDGPLLDELVAVVDAKNDLDFNFANQAVLKYWFFLHLPLTCALLIFAAAHVLLVYAFGAAR